MAELDDLDEIKLLALDHFVAKKKVERAIRGFDLSLLGWVSLCGKYFSLLTTKIISLGNGLAIRKVSLSFPWSYQEEYIT